jgi:GNAT superfamily N-acetyltransferase
MLIRQAKNNDLLHIGQVNVAVWQATYRGLIPDQLLDELSAKKQADGIKTFVNNKELLSFVLVAEDDKNIIGYIIGGKQRGEENYQAEVYAIYVLQEHQHKGIGFRLIESAVYEFQKMNFTSLIIWGLKENPYCRFYEKLGGKIVGTKKFHGTDLAAYGWDDMPGVSNPRRPFRRY